ncbi:MAG TPA: hypothetical protein VGA62_04250 [Acidimicrobiia bacterium]
MPGVPPDEQVHYYIANWAPADLAEITSELDRRGVTFTIDGDDLCIHRRDERMVDMLVESVTEE